CMVELRQAHGGPASAGTVAPAGGQAHGLYSRGFGGDTLNTAVYLARLDVKVDYFTALGDDALSDEMLVAWTAEGVGTRRVV
ncbi:PfkB family carbohydrate kinase, partial [Aeromonas veronii]|uniref:PfkB family carbohydrate kinase n=1 Tax=Aeromonas veronii TaxID=654 RepID=UPI00406CBE42